MPDVTSALPPLPPDDPARRSPYPPGLTAEQRRRIVLAWAARQRLTAGVR